MTLIGFLVFLVACACILPLVITLLKATEFSDKTKLIIIILSAVVIFIGVIFYYNGTASGKRALVDQRSEFSNGMEREINVYTADGNLIAHYEGRIDLEDNEGGYVIFDYEGKRYTYYNCFVESIANID